GVARRRGGAGYLLLGDALDEARALAEAAAPGRVLSGGVPGRLAQAGFSFREAAPLKRRGRRIRATGGRGARTAPPPPPAARTLCGRGEGRAGFVGAWRGGVDAAARVAVGLVGEAGIGKSRLIAELYGRVADEHGEARLAAARPGGGDTPYAAVCDLLVQELDLPPARTPAARARPPEQPTPLPA